LPGDLGIAADMCRSLLEQQHDVVENVPDRRWFQVIMRLLRCCENVETIEVPPEWENVQWYDGNFPKIDQDSKRQLGNARWRWGVDPFALGEEDAGGMEVAEESDDEGDLREQWMREEEEEEEWVGEDNDEEGVEANEDEEDGNDEELDDGSLVVEIGDVVLKPEVD
jgi:hypothetical protein